MKEVILLGSGKTAETCPFNGTEIWATANILPRIEPISDCSKVFIIGNGYKKRGAISLAKSQSIPIVSIKDYATEKFPIDEITARFKTPYFRCALSYMLAYAIYLGYEKITLYGMEPDDEWERTPDLPRIAYWLGVARGLGIEWELTPGSRLWAVMQESVAKQYEISEFRNNLADSVFMQEAKKHGDPYCFVSGVDTSAITVTSYGDGKEISKWHP